MNPLFKGLLATVLLSGGGYIWFGFYGYWTLSGLAMLWAGGWLIGELAAEVSFKK